MDNKIYIIIVTWNGQQYITSCLNSIFAQAKKDFSVIVVDNNSNDQTKDIIRNNYPVVSLIENKSNLGFARANNIGIKKAIEQGANYIVLLNQDTEVKKDFLIEGLKYFEKNPILGLASPIILYPDEKRIWFAGSKIYRNKEILIKPTTQIGEHIHKKQIFSEADKKNSVAWVPACALIIKKEVFDKIGYLDETFFMYGGDVDFSLKAKAVGIQLGYILNTLVIHKESIKPNIKINKYLFRKIYWRTKARLKIVWHYYNFKEKCYYIIKLFYLPFYLIFYVFKKIFS